MIGKANIVWPGLNAPIIKGRELVERQKLPEDPEREEKLIKIRSEMGQFRQLRLSPIERGWTGAKMPGRSIGPPTPVGEGDTFLLMFYFIIYFNRDLQNINSELRINVLILVVI